MESDRREGWGPTRTSPSEVDRKWALGRGVVLSTPDIKYSREDGPEQQGKKRVRSDPVSGIVVASPTPKTLPPLGSGHHPMLFDEL